MNDLAALLGGGAAPVAPLPSSPDPALDPLAGIPPEGQGAFPSTDPAFVGSVLEQLLMAKQADHMALEQQQNEALMSNPLLEALLAGAPLAPGAGQDAQAIGPTGDIPPDPASAML